MLVLGVVPKLVVFLLTPLSYAVYGREHTGRLTTVSDTV